MRNFLYWTSIAGLFLFVSSCHHDPPIGFCKATLNGKSWKSDYVTWNEALFDTINQRISIGFSKQLGYSSKVKENTSIGFSFVFPALHRNNRQFIHRKRSSYNYISDTISVGGQSLYGDPTVYGSCRLYEVDTTATNYIRITGYNEESGEVYAEFEVTLISDDPCDKLYPKKLHFKDGQMTAVKR